MKAREILDLYMRGELIYENSSLVTVGEMSPIGAFYDLEGEPNLPNGEYVMYSGNADITPEYTLYNKYGNPLHFIRIEE